MFNKISIIKFKYYSKSYLYKSLDAFGKKGKENIFYTRPHPARLRRKKPFLVYSIYKAFLSIFSVPILNFFRQNFFIISIGLDKILVNPGSLILIMIKFIRSAFPKLKYVRKLFMHKFQNIKSKFLSKYFFLFKRKKCLSYSKTDNKYLFNFKARFIKNKKKKSSKLISLLNNKLFL